ncbi:MAG: AMP-dependent synthetase, partial [Planctomycetes bacterium]|nr:AMP-dependent synthetase [Planctomycetota bacterium]
METARDGREELTAAELVGAGLAPGDAPALLAAVAATAPAASPEERWRAVVRDVLRPDLPFGVHRLLFSRVYAGRGPAEAPAPAFVPEAAEAAASRAGRLMAEKGFASFAALHAWSVADRAGFWGEMLTRIGVRFRTPPGAVIDASGGAEAPRWLPGAVLNIAD